MSSGASEAERQSNGAAQDVVGDPNDLLFWFKQQGRFPLSLPLPELAWERGLRAGNLAEDISIDPEAFAHALAMSISALKSEAQRRDAMMYFSGYVEPILERQAPDYRDAVPNVQKFIRKHGILQRLVTPALRVIQGGLDTTEKTDAPSETEVAIKGEPEPEAEDVPNDQPQAENVEAAETVQAREETSVAQTESAPDTSIPEPPVVETKKATPRPGPLTRLFGEVIDETAANALKQLSVEQREAFLYVLTGVYERNSSKPGMAATQVQKINFLMQGMSAQRIVEQLGLNPGSVESMVANVSKILGREAGTIRSALENMDETVRVYQRDLQEAQSTEGQTGESSRQDTDIEALAKTLNKLLGRRGVSHEVVTDLAKHFAGKKVETESADFTRASLELRHEIGVGLNIVKHYRPDARDGRLAPEDLWLFANLLGNPNRTDMPPRTLPHIYQDPEMVKRFGRISLIGLQIRVQRALQHLDTTLRSR